MYKSYEFSIEVWPGVVRIHQGYETDDWGTVELDPSQVDGFCETLKKLAKEAKDLGEEFDRYETEVRVQKAAKKSLGSVTEKAEG